MSLPASGLSVSFSPQNPGLQTSYAEKVYSQKAEHVFNFTRYIHWPDLTERDLRHQITLCLQSDSKSFAVIEELAQKHKVGERQLNVQVSPLDKDKRCDLIYIEQPGVLENHISQAMLHKISQEVVLVAAHSELYPEVSAISFYQQEKRLRFEVNMNIINRLKAGVSSELLKLARIRQIPDNQDGATIQGGEQE